MPGLILTALLGAALATADGQGASPPRPLHLVTDRVGTDIRIRVVGQGKVACNAAYALTISSRTAAGSNRSVQRGSAHIRPGAPVTFATSTLARTPAGSWTAQLAVRGCGAGADYRDSSGAAAPPR